MRQKVYKIKTVLKALFIFLVIACIFITNIFATQLPMDKQTFDMKAASIISIGFGASCSIWNNYLKKHGISS